MTTQATILRFSAIQVPDDSDHHGQRVSGEMSEPARLDGLICMAATPHSGGPKPQDRLAERVAVVEGRALALDRTAERRPGHVSNGRPRVLIRF